MDLKDKTKKLSDEEKEKVSGGGPGCYPHNGPSFGEYSTSGKKLVEVSVAEPNENDPRCPSDNAHLNFKFDDLTYYWFKCTGCNKLYIKNHGNAWHRVDDDTAKNKIMFFNFK